MFKVSFSILVLLFLLACGYNQELSEEKKTSLKHLGDSIAIEAQGVLLRNVAAAIQKGGTDDAVDFCNTNAIPLTDSVANNYKTTIKRLSDKNRNPNNNIQTEMDHLAWQKIKSEEDFIEHNKKGEIFYYKAITIAMPTCLKCHGDKNDIIVSTQKLINKKYPNDKATGYKMGELRGMWKIQIQEKN